MRGVGGGRHGWLLVAPGEDTGSRWWGQGSFGLLGREFLEADFLGCFHVRLGNEKSHLLASVSDQIHCSARRKQVMLAEEGAAAAPATASPSPGCRAGLQVPITFLASPESRARRGAYLM